MSTIPPPAAEALSAERRATAARLATLESDLTAVVASTADSNLDDEHDPEGATIAFEREQLAALRDQAREQLTEIDAALERVASGTYGICQGCGGAIGDDRLAARPFARYCIRCASGR